MPVPKIDNVLDLIDKHWHFPFKRELLAFAVILAFEMSILLFVEATSLARIITICVTVLLVIAFGLYTRRLEKTKKNKIGFVISLAFDDEAVGKKIKEDFIFTLRNLLKAGKAGAVFQVIEISNDFAKTVVDIDDAQKLRLKTNAHFVLYGRVRLREFDKQDHHFFDLNGVVAHRQVDENISQLLSKEFSELLPRQVRIPKENDLVSFQFTSEWTESVAKYIIGIAASISGDLTYAEQLHQDVLTRLGTRKHNFPVFAKLQQRIPLRLSEIAEARGRHAYAMWLETRDGRFLDDLGQALEVADKFENNRISLFYFHAVFHFLRHRDAAKALEFLNKCHKSSRDTTWHFNVAFLHAYKGNMPTAVRHYRNALALPPMQPSVFAEIEDFLLYIATVDTEKFQLFYCLGFINWHVKGDSAQAIKDFLKFLECGDPSQFAKERNLAMKWVAELNG